MRKTNYLGRSYDWSEEDLTTLTKEEFIAKFAVSGEEWEMLQKELQEM